MRYLLIFFAAVVALSSCTINKNVMFRTDTDYEFDVPSEDTVNNNLTISPNDRVLFRLFSNEGARLIELTAGINDGQRLNAILPNFTYTVQPDGYLELPEVGLVYLAGMNIQDAQLKLEELYSEFYKKPFAILEIVNNRAIVFNGNGGTARVIDLTNQNITVIEALALAGGITQRGDASQIKLIRRFDDKPYEVYMMDLSTIEGIKYANMVVQANDVIYVEPVPEIAAEVFRDISPFVSIVSGVALIYAILRGTL